jgi:hypothetical protein
MGGHLSQPSNGSCKGDASFQLGSNHAWFGDL